MKNYRIFVTKPSLPDLKDLVPYLEKIWESKIILITVLFINSLKMNYVNFLMFRIYH